MLGALLCGVVGYKVGKNKGKQEARNNDAEDTNRLYEAQLKCITQCKAMELAARTGGTVDDIIDIYNT